MYGSTRTVFILYLLMCFSIDFSVANGQQQYDPRHYDTRAVQFDRFRSSSGMVFFDDSVADESADKPEMEGQKSNSGDGKETDKKNGKDADKSDSPKKKGFDESVVAAGRAAFASACVSCHDAERSTGKSKSLSAWVGTVRRMAAKDGADVASSDVVPIATYLASLSRSANGSGGSDASGSEDGSGDDGSAGADGWSFGTTVSTLHRSGSDESIMENPGFFADVWVTASYQSSGPWRANVTACTSCHSTDSSNNLNGYSLELVEGTATFDLRHWVCGRRPDDGRELLLKAGRFVTPFGAFSSMSHPGVYRTLTNPLIFNMGRRVLVPDSSPPLQPVLPMPFSDEGVDLMYRTPLGDDYVFTLDLYGVNGLQGVNNRIFNLSRSYVDNNEEPSLGSRMTLGCDCYKVGTSVLGGHLQNQQLPAVDYMLFGADFTTQLTQRLRFYSEYAMRRQDSLAVAGANDNVYGIVTELEHKLCEQPNIGFLVRYDTLEHRNPVADATLRRLTWGLNIGLPGGSLLMINHEHWMPRQGEDVDVVGVRWSVSL